jgi:hypothetical protein
MVFSSEIPGCFYRLVDMVPSSLASSQKPYAPVEILPSMAETSARGSSYPWVAQHQTALSLFGIPSHPVLDVVVACPERSRRACPACSKEPLPPPARSGILMELIPIPWAHFPEPYTPFGGRSSEIVEM